MLNSITVMWNSSSDLLCFCVMEEKRRKGGDTQYAAGVMVTCKCLAYLALAFSLTFSLIAETSKVSKPANEVS